MAGNASEIQLLAHQRNCRLVLLEDVVVAPKLEPAVVIQTVAIEMVPSDMLILDLGRRMVARIAALLEETRTLVWNGPLGAFETPPFDWGTVTVANKIAELTRAGKLFSVAGGGDTVAALDAAGVTNELSYVSTAGGAFLGMARRPGASWRRHAYPR